MLQQVFLERNTPLLPRFLIVARRIDHVAVGHDNDHRDRLAVGNQVVGDHVGAAQDRPVRIVVPTSVQQVQYRVFATRFLAVARWRVNVDPAARPADLRVVPVEREAAVWHSGTLMVPRLALGNEYLDEPARTAAIAEDVRAGRIRHYDTVHVEGVVVDARRYRTKDNRPDSVIALGHLVAGILQNGLEVAAVQ